LVSEHALNAFANGYVKSTAGVPSTIAVIPVAEGGTGATVASTARTNLGVGNVGTLNLNGDPNAFLSGTGAWAYPTHPQQIPSGMLAHFNMAACPPGWTRVAAWDGYFLRPSAVAGGSGGATNHYHGADGGLIVPAHQHAAAGLTMPWHSHGGVVGVSGNTGSAGDHTHGFGIHQTTGDNNAGNMNVDAGNSGNMSRGSHTHNIDVQGNTDGGGTHTHSFSGSGGIPNDGGQAIDGLTAMSGAMAVTGNVGWATNHYPPFVDVLLCSKD
jgi:hypothetical protein